jgi:acyl-coenzyme A synthetase/AMP-(fatty) acid ligase
MPLLSAGAMLVTSPAHLTRIAGIEPLGAGAGPAMVFSAGAPLPPAAAAEAAAVLGVIPTEIFGSTETGSIGRRRAMAEPEAWRPIPGINIKLTDDGRLAIRSPFVSNADWHETDDLAALAPEGGFHLKGRADRVVKIEGKRVSLPELERLLAGLPWIGSAAVAMTGPKRQRLGAAVVLTTEGKQKLDALGPFRFGRFLRRALSAAQEPAGLPRSWRFVEALPVGHMGKRREADVAALFDAETADA